MFNFQASKKNEKDTMDANTADDFRHSKDPTDRVLWHMRSDAGHCFDVCFGGEKTSGILGCLQVFEKHIFGEAKFRCKNRPLFGDETTSGTTYISTTVGFKGWEGNMGTPELPRKSVLCCQGSEKPPL